jgi:type II secretory pathway pseudopilin PulG
MTLLELMIVTTVFSVVMLVAYGALLSIRTFTRANVSQVELQEEARHALESMVDKLQNAGRFIDTTPPKPLDYPKIFIASDASGKPGKGFPKGYNNANDHATKNPPKAKPGSNVNGGDPTLDSNEMIFKIPSFGVDGLPVLNSGAIVWSGSEYGFFVVPDPLGGNRIEWRDSSVSEAQAKAKLPVEGELISRFVDRLQIDDYTTDPTLTTRQLKVTIYLTRAIQREGEPIVLSVSISGVVDMRNTSQFQ